LHHSSIQLFPGALEAFLGSATWQYSVIASSDAQVYQFSRVSFLEKFPLRYLEMFNTISQETFFCMHNQLERSLRCALNFGWSPIDIHPLVDCELLVRDDRNIGLADKLHALLKEKTMRHFITRRDGQ